MKRFITFLSRFVMALMAIVIITTVAGCQSRREAVIGTACGSVNVMAQPDSNSNIVLTLNNSQEVEVLGVVANDENWVQVRSENGVEGFCHTRFLFMHQGKLPKDFGMRQPSADDSHSAITVSLPAAVWVLLFIVQFALIIWMLYYYLTPIERNSTMRDRLWQLSNTWVGNVCEPKSMIWAWVAFILGWTAVLFVPIAGVGNKYSALMLMLLAGGLAANATQILRMVNISGYYTNGLMKAISFIATIVGEILMLCFALFIAIVIPYTFTLHAGEISWMHDSFWWLLLALLLCGIFIAVVGLLWLVCISTIFRAFGNVSVFLIGIGMTVAASISCGNFLYANFNGFLYILGIIVLVIYAFLAVCAYYGLTTSDRCPNCHSSTSERTGVVDLGVFAEKSYYSRRISNSSVSPHTNGAEVSNAREHGIQTDFYHRWVNQHRCKKCNHNWDEENAKLVGSEHAATSQHWQETT